MSARAEVYFALAECLKEPTAEFAGDVASGLVKDVLSEAFSELQLAPELETEGLQDAADAEDVLDRLLSAYHALFTVPSSRFVLPVESVFKEWRGEEGLGAGSGMIMGPSALDMAERYRARGLEIPREMKDSPDHLALLLEYGGLLCEEGVLDEQREFVATHLDRWIDVLVGQVESLSEVPFYRAAARALRAFVRSERRHFGLPEFA